MAHAEITINEDDSFPSEESGSQNIETLKNRLEGIEKVEVKSLELAIENIGDQEIVLFDLDGTLVHNLTYIPKKGIELISNIKDKFAVSNRGPLNSSYINSKTERMLSRFGISSIFYKQDRQNFYGTFRDYDAFNRLVDSITDKLNDEKDAERCITLVADMGIFNKVVYGLLGVNEAFYIADIRDALYARGYTKLEFKVIEINPNLKIKLEEA